METIEKTLPELCKELGFKVQVKKAKAPYNASKWQKESNAWVAIVSYNDYSLAVPYFTGASIEKITVADVIYSLCSDWSIWKSCENVQGFASEFGWDDETLSTWEKVEKGAKEWEHFIGDASIIEKIAEVQY